MAWPRRGTRLMIVDDAAPAWGEADIWVYRPITGVREALTHTHEVVVGTPASSPDSRRIATTTSFTDPLVCGETPIDARHLAIVVESLYGGSLTRETEPLLGLNPGRPERGTRLPDRRVGRALALSGRTGS